MHKYPKILAISILFLTGFLSNKALAQESLTWGACIEEARKNHPDLISAQEGVKQYEAGKKITASTLYPQIDSSADVSRERTKTTASGKTTKKTDNSFGYGVTGSQLLFDGLKTANDLKAASEDIKAAEFNYKFTSSEVRLRLRTAFINLLKAQESLKITQDIYDIRRGNLELITLRYESGIEHRGALLTAEANLAQSEFEIAQNKRALEVAQRELIKEMGRVKSSPIRVEGEFRVADAALEKPDFEVLANKNPSLGKLAAQKNAASFGIKAAKADFLPQLSAQTGASKSNSHWPPDNEQLSAGLSLSLPLFEGGLRLAQVAQAKAIFNQAQADERSAKDSIILSLQQSWAALADAVGTVKVQSKFLEAIEERARISEAQYSLGLIQFDNWTIIEDQLVNAKKSFLDAQANALLAEASWVQAKGETLEYAN
ncbi:MAG: TolC family protein [Candidatus Omnitrophota bacterium]